MTKNILTTSLLLAFLCCCTLLKNSRQAPPEIQKKEYAEFFKAQLRALPSKEEVQSVNKFNRPDMFFLFDRMKRVNPATGRYPADGLLKAWEHVQNMESFRTGTGYAVTWMERGPNNVGGRTRAFMWDPNDVNKKAAFAGGVGGSLFRTNDVTVSTPNWSLVYNMFSNVAVTCLAYDPTNTQIMYFGTGEGWMNADGLRGAGVWQSTNGGSSWNLLPSTANSTFFFNQKIAVNFNGHVFVGTKGGLYKSTDDGLTWTKVLGNGTGLGSDWITDIEIAADNDLFVGIGSSGIFQSSVGQGAAQGDIGSWTKLSTGFAANIGRVEIACAPSDANYLYAITVIGDAVDQVYRSTNGGSSWAATATEPGSPDMSNGQGWYDLSLAVSPTNRSYVYAGGVGLYRTTNGGSTWSSAINGFNTPAMHVDQHGVFFLPGSQSTVVFSNDGGLYYTSNSLSTAGNRNDDYNVTQFYSISVDPRAGNPGILGGTQDNGSMILTANGISPASGVNGSDGGYCAINHQDPDTMYVTTQYETVRRSKNGGASTSGITNPNLSSNDVMFINPLEMDPNNPNQLYQASSALWRHNSAASGTGSGWTQCTKDLASGVITAIGISKSTANLVYIAAGGSVYRIPNANAGNASTNPTAVNSSGIPGGYINCIAVNPADGNHIVLTYSSYGLSTQIAESRNANLGASATWKSLKGNLPDLPCNWAVFEPNNNNKGVLIGTDLGVFRCADITALAADIFWSPERTGMGYPRVEMLEVRDADKSVHASTHGRGFFSTYSYVLSPVAHFGVENLFACGGDVHFIDSSANVPTGWSWDFGDGGTSTSQSPVHHYNAGGTYNVKLTVTNVNGNSNVTKTFLVTVLPGITAYAGPDTTGCKGDTIQMLASGGQIYSWSPNDNLDNPNIGNPITIIDGNRTYIVTVTDSNGCIDKDTVVVTQGSAPNVWAGQDKTLNSLTDSVQLTGFGGITFLWTPSTGLDCDTCPSPMASPDTTTTYTLTSCSATGCCNTDDAKVSVLIVGNTKGQIPGNNFLEQPWPNPARAGEQVEVRYGISAESEIHIDLIDMKGSWMRTIDSGTGNPGIRQMAFSTAGVKPGIYFVRLRTGKQTIVKKLLLL